MRNIKFKNGVASLVLATLGIMTSLSGCGKKEMEFTDYGTILEDSASQAELLAEESAGGSEKESGNESDNGAEKASDDKEKNTLYEKLGISSEIAEYSSEFTATGLSIGMDINSQIIDSDKLPTYKVTKTSEEDIHEADIVKNIFGDTAVALNTEEKTTISPDNGDSPDVVEFSSWISSNNGQESTGGASAKTWIDEKDFFLHIYEGTYNDIDYQLMIAYSKKDHEKSLCLYPKNVGELVNNPELDTILPTSSDGTLTIYSTYSAQTYDTRKIMADRPNRCSMTAQQLNDLVIKTAREKLYVEIPTESFSFSTNYYEGFEQNLSDEEIGTTGLSELVFFDESEAGKTENLPGAVIDGYAGVYLSSTVNNQTILDYTQGMGDFYIPQDVCSFSVNDKGLIAFSIVSKYNFIEKVSENVDILSFEDGMKAFETAMADKLDLAKTNIKSEQYSFNHMGFYYCPVPTDKTEKEFLLVPAWVGEISKAGSTKARGIISAVDGEFIKLIYN